LRLRFRSHFALLHEHRLRLKVTSEEASEASSRRLHLAGLRQPHVKIEPNEGGRCHLVGVDVEELENLYHHRIQRVPKAGDEKIAEDHDLVMFGLCFGHPGRRSPCEANFKKTSPLHVFDHDLRHVTLPKDASRRKSNPFVRRHVLRGVRLHPKRRCRRTKQRTSGEAAK